jgi:hypothetical protein
MNSLRLLSSLAFLQSNMRTEDSFKQVRVCVCVWGGGGGCWRAKGWEGEGGAKGGFRCMCSTSVLAPSLILACSILWHKNTQSLDWQLSRPLAPSLPHSLTHSPTHLLTGPQPGQPGQPTCQ